VHIKQIADGKGEIVVNFYTMDDLERITELLGDRK